jgi:HEPN domain-containing protein
VNKKFVLLKQWLDKAEMDLAVINILQKSKSAPTSATAFHCQQAIEKYLKGFLGFNDVAFAKTHDLNILLELCLQKDAAFKILNRDYIADIKTYAVNTRYPGEEYEPPEKELVAYVKVVKQVKFLVEKLTK